MPDIIGLIAGGGRFPVVFAQEARRMGKAVVAVGIEGTTDPELESEVERLEYFKLGQLTRPIRFLRQAGVSQAVMAGKVQHSSLFGGVLPDAKALKILSRLKDRRSDSILGAIAEEFAQEGIQLISSATFLTHLIPGKGPLTPLKPTASEREDIRMGWNIAKTLAGLDVGQTVVIQQGAVVAVEGMEGTDACVLRAGQIARRNGSPPGLVVVKVAKPNQDFRFDLPVIGMDTLQTIRQAGVRVLALEAEKSIILDRERFIQQAEALDAAILALEDAEAMP